MKTIKERFTWKIGEKNGDWLNVCIIETNGIINKIWIYNVETNEEKVGWTTNLYSFLSKKIDKQIKLEKNYEEKIAKATLALELLNPNSEGFSRWIKKSEFVGRYEPLFFNNGNTWYRDGKLAKYIFERRGHGINYECRLAGLKENHNTELTRFIRPDIRKEILNQKCVHTGFGNTTNNHIVVDHKNGRYNEINVLILAQQNVDDFQPLCNQANLLKRSDCQRCLLTGKRFDATILGYKVSYSSGSEVFDSTASNGCIGCYWHDPLEFKKSLDLLHPEKNYI
jgi:hypothetical protein